MDEGPVVLGLTGTHAGVEGRLRAGEQAGQGGRRRDGRLEGPAVRALDALAFARVTGIGAPTTAGLVQALATRSVPGAVLRWKHTRGRNSQKLHISKCVLMFFGMLTFWETTCITTTLPFRAFFHPMKLHMVEWPSVY